MFELLKPFLSADFIGKMVRTGIQSVTSGMVAAGTINGDQQTQVAGAVGLVASVLWTVLAHSKVAAKYGVEPNSTTGGLQ